MKETINIMTANIRFANQADGENNWPNRKEFVSHLITREEISLLGTQEGREVQIKELQGLLPHLQLVENHREWIEERMYPCLFFNPSVFKLNRSGDIWLSKTPHVLASKSFGSMFPRLCTYAELTSLKTDKSILAINCHLDHIEEEIRLNQIKVLIEQVNLLNTSRLPIVLLGDFNSGPSNSVRKEIEKSELNLFDPWIKLGLEETTSFHKFDGSDPSGKGLRIDWTLIDKTIEARNTEMIKDSKENRYPSDHFFIKTQILV